MLFPPFQEQVAEFVSLYDLEIPANDRLLDLISELGELAKEFLKNTDYGKNDFYPTHPWVDELGDVFFALVCLANSTEVNLLQTLNAALAKYQTRFDDQGEVGSGQ